MPSLRPEMHAVRIPDKRWLTQHEREVLDEMAKDLTSMSGAESSTLKVFNWMVFEICHLREERSNLGWQLNPDQMGR